MESSSSQAATKPPLGDQDGSALIRRAMVRLFVCADGTGASCMGNPGFEKNREIVWF